MIAQKSFYTQKEKNINYATNLFILNFRKNGI